MRSIEGDRLALLDMLYDKPDDTASQAAYCDFLQENNLLPSHAAILQKYITTGVCDLYEFGPIVRGPIFRFVTGSATEYRLFRDTPTMQMSIDLVGSKTQEFFRAPGCNNAFYHINPRSSQEIEEYRIYNRANQMRGYRVNNVFYIRNGFVHTIATTYREWLRHGRKWCHENPVQFVELYINRLHTTHPKPFRYDAGRWVAEWKFHPSYAHLHRTPQRKQSTPKTNATHAQDCENEMSAALIHWGRNGLVFEDPVDVHRRDIAQRNLFM